MANYARNHVCTLFSARVHLRQCPLWPATMHPPLLCKIIWNKKRNSQTNDGNLLFQGARRRAHQHVQILNGCHIINANWKCATLFFNRLCHSGLCPHTCSFTRYI